MREGRRGLRCWVAMFNLPLELMILGLLVVANGVLAMAETAVVSAKKTKLRKLAAKGDVGAGQALELAAHPARFLALVEFWLTLSGMIAGVLAGTVNKSLVGAINGASEGTRAAVGLCLGDGGAVAVIQSQVEHALVVAQMLGQAEPGGHNSNSLHDHHSTPLLPLPQLSIIDRLLNS